MRNLLSWIVILLNTLVLLVGIYESYPEALYISAFIVIVSVWLVVLGWAIDNLMKPKR